MMSSVLARGRGRWSKTAGLLGVLLVVVFGAMVPGAWALNTVPSAPTYTGGARFGLDASSKHAVVEPSTGNLLVTNYNAGRIDVLAPDGTSLTTIDTGPGSQPYGIAIDATSGTVYVSLDGTAGIARYTSDGAPVPTYTLDAGYASPVLAVSAALAIDPTTHDLLVANQLDQQVYRITPGGTQSSYSGAGSPGGAFTHLLDIAAAPNGHSYVLDSDGGNLFLGGHSRVVELDTTDSPIGELAKADGASLDNPSAVTVDASSGRAIVSGDTSYLGASTGPRLYVYDNGANAVATFEYPDTYFQGVASIALAADPGRGHRLYSLLPDFVQVQTFDLSATPGLDIDAPSQVAGVSMHLSGTVNPAGFAATGFFEYSDDGGTTYQATPVQNLGSGPSGVAISADITGLTPVHDYEIRLVGTSSAGTVRTEPLTVQTTTNRPVVVTGRAVDRTTTSATLLGQLNPGGLQTVYHVEYGTTSSYGSRMPANYDQVAGNGAINRPTSIGVSGLSPGTTYHYRLVAGNSQGTSEGTDRTFTTESSSQTRQYEQVSPVEKGGGGVSLDPVQTADGNAAVFRTHTAAPGSPASPKFPTYIARRGASGWSSKVLDLPQSARPSGSLFQTVVAVSPDLTKTVAFTSRKLADGAVEGSTNFYLSDTTTGALRTIATTPNLDVLRSMMRASGNLNVVSGSTDFSTLTLTPTNGAFFAGVPASNGYRWRAGQLTLVSVDEHGDPFPAKPLPGPIAVSRDGTRLVYNQPSGSHSAASYVRDGDDVLPISAGQSSDIGAVTPDVGVVYFIADHLTSDPAPAHAIYRYDVEARRLTFIAPTNVQQDGILGASDDGSYMYFISDENLAPGGGAAGNHLYAWHNGQFTLVTTPTGALVSAQVSPSGKYLTFATGGQLTDYDPHSTACGGACPQVYRYDLDADELTCASCRPDGAAPTGPAGVGKVLDDGRVIFDSPEPLSVGDTNSKRDVYSFDGTQATLISGGTGPGDSTYVGAGPDGRDVFFATNDQLVGQDTDNQTDVYDAREGGGIAAQQKVPETAPCSGDGCLGASAAPVALVSAATITFSDAGNLAAPKLQSSKVKASVRRKVIRGSVFAITVKTANKGRITASGSGLRTVTRTATKAGSYKLTIRLTRAAEKRLRSKHRLGLKVRLTFTPTNTTPSTTTVSVTLKG